MKINFNTDYIKSMPLQSEFAILSHGERNILHNIILQLADNSNVVEVGSALGGATCLMAAVNPTISIIAIEAFQNNIWSWETQIRPMITAHMEHWYNNQHIPKEQYQFLLSTIIPHIDLCFETDQLGVTAFNFITSQFPNIKLFQGESPNICAGWTTPIDLYFEDAQHGNPALQSNINFWIKHIKPNGFIVGHDYNDSFPDVVSEFNFLIQQGWHLIAKVESLIVLQKPE